MLDVATAVEFAHQRGVVHCDLKPSNVLLDSHGVVRINDFGLALQDRGTIISLQGAAGTPAFMAPEQLRRRRADHRADLFSAGVILYRLLAHVLPFREDRPDLVHRMLEEEPVPVTEIEPRLPFLRRDLVFDRRKIGRIFHEFRSRTVERYRTQAPRIPSGAELASPSSNCADTLTVTQGFLRTHDFDVGTFTTQEIHVPARHSQMPQVRGDDSG